MAWRYLDLADFLLIAEAVLDIRPRTSPTRRGWISPSPPSTRLRRSSGGVEFYTDLAAKTAVLASRIIRNHPLPDGNKRVGYLCALEFVARNGGTWSQPAEDPEGDETVAVIEGVAAGEVDEERLRAWVSERLA